MRLRQRLERLEARAGASRACPECGGRGRVRWALEPTEGERAGGCPRCGRGLLLAITVARPTPAQGATHAA